VSLALVLVEPAGPLNVGSVARLCANFGIAQLRLVAPRCDHRGPEARLMAVHGGALLDSALLFPDLAAALADCRRVVATSGRIEQEGLPLSPANEALAWLRQDRSPALGALVFGREDRGLSNDELLLAGRVVRLSTDAAYSSLNLSHAVAICLHELQQLGEDGGMTGTAAMAGMAAAPADDAPEPCPRAALEAALADAEALLLDVGFLYPHTAHARMAKLRGLLQRAQVTDAEVALLRGMVRQLRWAAQQRTP
jgi:tRNA/rRNA methyltransferase